MKSDQLCKVPYTSYRDELITRVRGTSRRVPLLIKRLSVAHDTDSQIRNVN